MLSFPNAKINLGLRVLRKRSDEFHDLDSSLVPIPLCDVLEVLPATGKGAFEFNSWGISIPGDLSSNLCYKAYHLLADQFALPAVRVGLLKRIPTGGGLAGGSSNGTFMLKALNELFELELSVEQLENYAAQLGSDCPFFVRNVPAVIAGRGEHVQPIELSLSNKWLALVTPGVHVSTAQAFGGITPKPRGNQLHSELALPIDQWQDVIDNDFESTVFRLYPQLSELKHSLLKAGALYAAMSGTGSTIFGIFESKLELDIPNLQWFRWS